MRPPDDESLFHEAVQLPPERRRALVEERCGGDRELFASVMELLAYDSAPGPINSDPNSSALTSPRFRELIGRLASIRRGQPRYRSTEVIGRGGMAVVELAEDDVLGRSVALKRTTATVSAQDESVESGGIRFLEEAQITGQLEHPGIPSVHEIGLDDNGHLYFTMPLVSGQTFESIIELVHGGADGWSVPRALDVLRRVCETVAYAHEMGVVHRDLKPTNVMVGRHGEVYVIDWGVAKVTSHGGEPEDIVRTLRTDNARPSSCGNPLRTLEGSVVGTLAYMPPEQAVGDLDAVDVRSDVYAAGAMLYHLLAGRPPYSSSRDDDSATVWRRVLAGPPEAIARIAPDASPELQAVCERAMERDAASRYPTMDCLARDLRAYVEGRVVAAYETGAWAELKKWISRNRLFATVAASFVILAVAAPLFLVWFQSESRARERLLTDIFELPYQLDLADSLLAANARDIPRMEEWIRTVESNLKREPDHRRELVRHDPQSEEYGHVERWLAAAATAWDVIERMESRLEVARALDERTRGSADARRAWAAAIDSIRSSEKYGGLELEPQYGLLPLRADPASGLWEFAHLQTGEPPEVGDDGEYLLSAETGLVFVLIPSGGFTMGAQRSDEERSNFDPAADEVREAPLTWVELDAFFLSKYEMTIAQWEAVTGVTPSVSSPSAAMDGFVFTGLHPVNNVSWPDCDAVLANLGLTLPTEAQWEYGCRAGTTTPFAFPAERLDEAVWHHGNSGEVPHPVGCKIGNAFGLHDMHGNLFEWCRDWFARYEQVAAARPGDGLRDGPTPRWKVHRGGAFTNVIWSARASYRQAWSPDSRGYKFGVRPARSIDG